MIVQSDSPRPSAIWSGRFSSVSVTNSVSIASPIVPYCSGAWSAKIVQPTIP